MENLRRALEKADFELIKERVCFKLVNENSSYVVEGRFPYRKYQDLAVIYFVRIQTEDVIGNALINKAMMYLWGITEEILYKYAYRNTMRLLKVQVEPLENVLKRRIEEEDFSDPYQDMDAEPIQIVSGERKGLYIVSNRGYMDGAAVILYEDVLKGFAREIKKDFYILPSSIHEVLFLPAEEEIEGEELATMVCDINKGCVSPEEKLSDHVYRYDKGSGCVMIVA